MLASGKEVCGEDEKNIINHSTSVGFLLRKVELILVKWEAMTFCAFISSILVSNTASQKGVSSWFAFAIQVSTIDQISLHNTSVATYGYLRVLDHQKFLLAISRHDVLVLCFSLSFYSSNNITE